MTRLALMILAVGCALGGCATVTRGTTSQVQLTSEPSGAEVRTSMGHNCRTPCTLSLNRRDEFVATFTAPGYAPLEIPVKTMVAAEGAAGFAGNILIGGVIGMTADAVSGATLQHVPNPVHAVLQRAGVPSRAAPPQRRRSVVAPTS